MNTSIAVALRSHYDYHAWANARILEASARVSREQLVESRGANFESLRGLLVHTMAAQWLYLERWQGRSPRAMPQAADFADLPAIAARWTEIERATHAFVAGVSDADVGRIVEYTNFQGERWAYPLWQQMMHQVNHGTQHRSEAAVVLTELGASPGGLDLLYFVDGQSARAH
jgi:uncharacterized damage-inducible protein DinB